MSSGMGYGIPPVYESYPFISKSRFAGKLKGKNVLVTGSSGGIGRAIALSFASSGANVACIARRQTELNKLVDEIKASDGHAIAIPADISERGAAQKIVAEAESKLGPIDVLCNNAGIARLSPLDQEDEDLDTWWRVYNLNVRAPVALIRAVLPGMLKRKSGIVISISSNVATMDLSCMTAYASSKAAISKFHESLVPELEGTGILSFAVNPGMVDTDLGSSDAAFNKDSMSHPAMQKFMATIRNSAHERQKAEVPADTVVALVAEPRCKVLDGHHVNAEQDLEQVLQEAEKEGKGRIGKERLYLVNIGFL